jgi:predicted DCC family thiol-disulfide oxidoreductase YuxK
MDWRLLVRRLLSELRSYLAELGWAARAGWNAFFFTAADPTALGVIRVATGLLAFWSLFVFGLDLHDYFGSAGWAEPSAIQVSQRALTWSFWFLVPDAWLRVAWLVCLGILALFTLGWFSRATAVLSWAIVVSTVRRVPIALYGFDQVISPLTLYLAVTGASGQAVSLDRFLRRWRQARSAAAAPPRAEGLGRRVAADEPAVPPPTLSANLALRLIQLHLVVIYAMAGLGKLQGPSWWNGLALWGTMTAGEFVVLDFTPMADWPLLINALTHASLALELLYPVLIWIRILRPMVLMFMLLLHLGIAVVSPGLAEFSLAMIAANLAFVSGSWLRGLVTAPDHPPLRVLFDGACPRCRRSLALITAADPDRVVELVDLTVADVAAIDPRLTARDCFRSMHAVSSAGRITSGFDAVRSVWARLPLFWPWAVIASIPGVAMLGRTVYNRLAATRPRDVPCSDATCGIHSGTSHSLPRLPRGHAQDPHNPLAIPADSEEVPHP